MAKRETKAERKERARRERLALQARSSRSQRTRNLVLTVTAVIASAAITYVVTRPPAPAPIPEGLDAVLASATAAQATAGCGEVIEVPAYQPESLDRSHTGGTDIDIMPALATYPSVPAASGPHSPSVLPAGVYERAPDMGTALHSLEHGGVIIWYSPDAPSEDVKALTDFYSQDDVAGERVIIAPYEYPDEDTASLLPEGISMAMVAWHRVQVCASVDPAAAFGFTARYAFPTYSGEAYLGEAPEPGAQM